MSDELEVYKNLGMIEMAGDSMVVKETTIDIMTLDAKKFNVEKFFLKASFITFPSFLGTMILGSFLPSFLPLFLPTLLVTFPLFLVSMFGYLTIPPYNTTNNDVTKRVIADMKLDEEDRSHVIEQLGGKGIPIFDDAVAETSFFTDELSFTEEGIAYNADEGFLHEEVYANVNKSPKKTHNHIFYLHKGDEICSIDPTVDISDGCLDEIWNTNDMYEGLIGDDAESELDSYAGRYLVSRKLVTEDGKIILKQRIMEHAWSLWDKNLEELETLIPMKIVKTKKAKKA